MPNTLSYLVLFSWPVFVLILFRILPRTQALCWSILGGYLALPFGIGINPPLLPTLNKDLIPALMAGILCLALADAETSRRRRRGDQNLPAQSLPAQDLPPPDAQVPDPQVQNPRAPLPARASRGAALRGPAIGGSASPAAPASGRPFSRARGRRAEAAEAVGSAVAPAVAPTSPASPAAPRVPGLILAAGCLLFANAFLTLMTNTAPYQIGRRSIQGLGVYDTFSAILGEAVLILPYLLGLRYLATPQQNRILLQVFVLAALAYSLPTLWEIRMSPQLNRTIYGYLSQPFIQAMRDGGFRPVVFLQHGLWLAIFNAMAALGAFAFWRNERAAGRPALWALGAGVWLSAVLALSNSLGALMILVLLLPVVFFLSLRLQLILAATLGLVLLLYPMLRGGGFIPTQAVYESVLDISAERANSLRIRLENEDRLLNHANEQPISGWGGYGRSRVYDPVTGEDISITDGMWVIVMGVSGWIGYVAKYGLLTLPILLIALRRRTLEDPFVVSGLALLLLANLVDMIANATMTPVTWLVAGALAGRAGMAQAGPQTTKTTGTASSRRRAATTSNAATNAATATTRAATGRG